MNDLPVNDIQQFPEALLPVVAGRAGIVLLDENTKRTATQSVRGASSQAPAIAPELVRRLFHAVLNPVFYLAGAYRRPSGQRVAKLAIGKGARCPGQKFHSKLNNSARSVFGLTTCDLALGATLMHADLVTGVPSVKHSSKAAPAATAATLGRFEF